MRFNTGTHPKAQPASPATRARHVPTELARRRHSTTGGLLDAAGQAFPAAGAGNVPSLWDTRRSHPSARARPSRSRPTPPAFSRTRYRQRRTPMTTTMRITAGFLDHSRVEVLLPPHQADRTAAWPGRPEHRRAATRAAGARRAPALGLFCHGCCELWHREMTTYVFLPLSQIPRPAPAVHAACRYCAWTPPRAVRRTTCRRCAGWVRGDRGPAHRPRGHRGVARNKWAVP